MASSRVRLTSRCQLSSFTAWSDDVLLRHVVGEETLSCLSLPADGDDVSPGEGWSMDWSMRLILMNKVSTVVRNSTFYVAHTSFGARGVRKNCVEGGVSSVACFFFQLTNVQ